jgi:DNA-binding HxlR family transcriptional regulator
VLKKRRRIYSCPIDVTLSVIGGKWKPLILFQLKQGPQRFSELQARLPRVSHKVLTQQLRQLEHAGIIAHQARARAYELTPFGKTLKPALSALASWGQTHHRALGLELASLPRADQPPKPIE